MAWRWRERLHLELDPQARAGGISLTNRLVMVLIVASSVTAVLATEAAVTRGQEAVFNGLEMIFAAIFLVEYGLRLWVAPVSGRHGRGWRAVLRYALTPAAILDLVAILPVLLMMMGGSLFILRLARVARLVRLARLGQFSHALDNIVEAVRCRAYELWLSVVVAFVLLLLSSTVVYLCEADLQPEAFGSIPRAMWWSLATLTTVGYGDAVPITAWGRIFAGLTAITGIGLIAMPAGILASAFSEAIQRRRRLEAEDPSRHAP
jgi:voltage-gated potassium channel